MNTQPLHVNEDFASRTEFKHRLVNGLYTLGLVVGLSVSDLDEQDQLSQEQKKTNCWSHSQYKVGLAVFGVYPTTMSDVW